MHSRTRRRLDTALVGVGCLAMGAVAAVGGVAGDQERVERLWTRAAVQDDGSAQIVEVVNYDFGSSQGKHGIFRDIPGLAPEDEVTVTSPEAPDSARVTRRAVGGEPGIRVRIGDPATTVSGSHTYRIEYTLPDVVENGRLDWDAVGTSWQVGIEEAEAHVVAGEDVVDAECFTGRAGSSTSCDADQVEPGHLTATADDLDAGAGVSIEAGTGDALAAAPALPDAPTDAPAQPGTGLVPPAGTAAAAGLVAAVPTAFLVRRAGRERVARGGAATAAFGGGRRRRTDPVGATGTPDAAGHLPEPPPDPAAPAGEHRLHESELHELVTTAFAPPEGITPSHGGIVLAEQVSSEHKTAWLIDAAVSGAVELHEEDGRTVGLTRRAPGRPDDQPVLDAAFDGRTDVSLGSYDPSFAAAWKQLDAQLERWRDTSGLWDTEADNRRVGASVLGVVVAVVGLLGVAGGGFLANSRGAPWLALVAVAGLVAGVGIALAITAWELRVRTPAGSAAWLRVESFRRFLAGSETYHAEQAAARGVLREYTAWAVALGEIDRWSQAVTSATAIPADAGLGYVYVAPLLMASTMSASTAPAPSGGGLGGGGFGGVGGGAGGGGGGSW